MGRVDVDGMLDEMSNRQFEEWRVADRLGLIGTQRRHDLRMAISTAALMNAAGAKKVGGGRFNPSDLMPDFTPAEPATPESIAIKLQGYMNSLRSNIP